MEYILALLLTSSVIFISYRVGKRAGIKEEQLNVEKQKNKQWEQFVQIAHINDNSDSDSVDAWVQERTQSKQ